MILRLSLTNFDKRKWNGVEIIFKPRKKKVEMTYVKYDKHGNPIKTGEMDYIYFS